MRHRIRTALAVPLLAGLLVLTACSGGGGPEATRADTSAGDRAGPDSAEEDAPADGTAGASRHESESGARADAEPGADDADPATARRTGPELPALHLVRTARLTVRVESVPEGYGEAVELVDRAGGYVSSEETYQHEDGQHSQITVRVPPEHYAGLLRGLSLLGELLDREVSTEDVTSEVVDVESRIATQEESVARVRALMAEAGSLTDVVQLERELTTRQAELESLKARQKSLSERTGMATVTLTLEEKPAEKKGKDEDKEKEDDGGPSIGGALSGGWNAFTGMLLWGGVVLGATLPFLLAAAVLVLAYRWFARHRRPLPPAPPLLPAPSGPPARSPQEAPAGES